MTNSAFKNGIAPDDLILLKKAKYSMENVGFFMEGLNSIGNTLESGIKMIPAKNQEWVNKKIQQLLLQILKTNLKTMKNGEKFKKPSSIVHKSIVAATGATSGFFGSANLVGTPLFIAELGVSTKFMMRSIMDIARSEGEDIYTVETQLACMEVFAIGGKSKNDDGLETAYYTSRIGLSSAMKGANSFISKYGMEGIGRALITHPNPLAKLLGIIASRFTVQVSEKAALQLVPIIGAITGGGINYLFINHFQKMATAHFTIRRLERIYGVQTVKDLYENL